MDQQYYSTLQSSLLFGVTSFSTVGQLHVNIKNFNF